MPEVHILRDSKRRTESKTRESASLQRAKRDERTNPSLSAMKILLFAKINMIKLCKICQKCIFYGIRKDGPSRRRGSLRLCSEQSETAIKRQLYILFILFFSGYYLYPAHINFMVKDNKRL